MTWLEKTPQAIVMAHIRMLRRLEAEERNDRAEEAGWGHSVKFKREAVRRMQADWQRAARPVRGMSLPTSKEGLRAHGIGRREVRRRKAR
jgi:hypothetical protein